MSEQILKYPRTHHIEGSRLQQGDEDLGCVKLSELAGQYLVIEEKLDGANSGISFTTNGKLLLQSRGHFLTGGHRERHFNLLKTWAAAHQRTLRDILGSRYVAYGEWVYAKHTVFYDQLAHYFLEFDVFDRDRRQFLSTRLRHAMFSGSPVVSVPVLWTGADPGKTDLERMITRSLYKSTTWQASLTEAASAEGLESERVYAETDLADEMEGLFIKSEAEVCVISRYKFVRASFLASVADSAGHWIDRPIVPNRLAPGVDIFAYNNKGVCS